MPSVPEQLRSPVETPSRQVDTLSDVALVLADYDQALGTANGRIVAIDCILNGAETGAEVECYRTEAE